MTKGINGLLRFIFQFEGRVAMVTIFDRSGDYNALEKAYEARLGRMTLEWGQMESALDGLCEVMFWLYRPERIGLDERPLGLEQKIKFSAAVLVSCLS